MGRAMKNLDKLLAMPYGCGEQNMLLFAPNIFILNYLKSTGQLTPDILEKAKRFLESGEFQTLRLKGIVSVSMQRQGPVPPDGGSAGGRYRLSEGAHLQARRRLVQRLRKQRRVRKHLVGKRGLSLSFGTVKAPSVKVEHRLRQRFKAFAVQTFSASISHSV